ncbi:MAG: 2-hydroxyacid dehydrogenase [Betaproteobacteria bacterium]
MTRLVFLHGLEPALAELIAATAPPGIDTVLVHRDEPEAEQARQVAQADFVMLYRAPLLASVMRGARRLRMVQLLASGYDGIALDLLHELGVACARNGGANARAVADQTVLMILALYRRLFETDREVRAGRWQAGITGLNTFEMAGKVMGIVGLGDIGRQVARRLQAFDAQVIYCNRNRLAPALEQELGVRYAPLDELLATADVISLHAPGSADSAHLIDAAALARMKRGALLINTGRGALIDEAALLQALTSGKLGGAGLDVFEQEPVAPSNPLLALPNVVLSPHTAGTTADTWARRGHFAYNNIERVLAGQPPVALVGQIKAVRPAQT